MTIMKKGTCTSSVKVSSSVYVCNSCGHTEIANGSSCGDKKCSKCEAMMSMMSTSEHESSNDNNQNLV